MTIQYTSIHITPHRMSWTKSQALGAWEPDMSYLTLLNLTKHQYTSLHVTTHHYTWVHIITIHSHVVKKCTWSMRPWHILFDFVKPHYTSVHITPHHYTSLHMSTHHSSTQQCSEDMHLEPESMTFLIWLCETYLTSLLVCPWLQGPCVVVSSGQHALQVSVCLLALSYHFR